VFFLFYMSVLVGCGWGDFRGICFMELWGDVGGWIGLFCVSAGYMGFFLGGGGVGCGLFGEGGGVLGGGFVLLGGFVGVFFCFCRVFFWGGVVVFLVWGAGGEVFWVFLELFFFCLWFFFLGCGLRGGLFGW